MVLNCDVGEDSWESLGLQGDQTSPSKGNQFWILIGSADAEAEAPILWPPDVKNWLIGKDSDAGKDWRLPGAIMRNSAHGKSWGTRLGIRKDMIKPQETPWSRASTLKPESVLCSHLHLWLYGGLSPIAISLVEGVNLQLQLIKIPGRDKNVSTYKLLWSFSSLPEQVRPATCDCLQSPNHERHEML